MTEILLTVIIILLIINIVIALTKNNRLQTERLEGLLREEMKENRDELGRNIRELRNELNQTLNYSIRNMQDTLHKNLLTCLLYTSPSPRDRQKSRMPSSA